MNFQEFFQSKKFKRILIGVGSLIVLLLVFQAGVFVGFRKAKFSYRWGENYHQMFGGSGNGFMRDFEGRDFIDGHGVAGIVVKIDSNKMVIKGQDGIEKVVVVSGKTSVKKGREDVKITELKTDEQVVVVGAPNENGLIEAKMIRVLDKNNSLRGLFNDLRKQ